MSTLSQMHVPRTIALNIPARNIGVSGEMTGVRSSGEKKLYERVRVITHISRNESKGERKERERHTQRENATWKIAVPVNPRYTRACTSSREIATLTLRELIFAIPPPRRAFSRWLAERTCIHIHIYIHISVHIHRNPGIIPDVPRYSRGIHCRCKYPRAPGGPRILNIRSPGILDKLLA